MKAMDHDTTGNIYGVVGGILVGIGSYLCRIDWSQFLDQVSIEGLKVAVFGVLGGLAGLLGKKLGEKLFFKKKRK